MTPQLAVVSLTFSMEGGRAGRFGSSNIPGRVGNLEIKSIGTNQWPPRRTEREVANDDFSVRSGSG